ncbi:MAG: class II aldolase/adducin family protein [Chloroflexi bacterium]|nr:class II aldolase/adducin family protein [Chloroflexota bacterium]
MQQSKKTLTDEVEAGRELVARIGRFLFDRHLTDTGGGNISLRVGDVFCMSPTLAGQSKQWQLTPEDVLVVSERGEILQGDGGLTRESAVHFGLQSNFSEYGTAVIHAHPRNLLVFACANMSMPPVMEATRKFGCTPVIEYAPAHSPKLGERIVATMRGREAMIAKHAAGALAPWHGLFLMGKNLPAALDAVERLDTNAYMLLMAERLGASPLLRDERAAMEQAIARFPDG